MSRPHAPSPALRATAFRTITALTAGVALAALAACAEVEPVTAQQRQADDQHTAPTDAEGSPATTDSAAPALEPVTSPEQLIGRWQALEPANHHAYIEFTEYGLWFGSDGCNGGAGTWSVDETVGVTASSAGVMRFIGCENVPIPQAFWSLESVEIRSTGELLITSQEDEPLTLVRTREDGSTLQGTWVGPATATSLTTLTFEPDGDFHALTSCGEAIGSWTLEALDDQEFQSSLRDELFISTGGLFRIIEAHSREGICVGEGIADDAPRPTDYYMSFGGDSFGIVPVAELYEEAGSPAFVHFHRIGSRP